MRSKEMDSPEYTLPATGFVRQKQLIPNIIPISRTTLWRKIKDGLFPAPVRLTTNTIAWRVEDVRAWMTGHGSSLIPHVSAGSADHALSGRTGGASTTASARPELQPYSAATVGPRIALPSRKWEEKLILEADAWCQSQSVRAYAAHVLNVVVADGTPPSSALLEWLKDATDFADRLDPTRKRLT